MAVQTTFLDPTAAVVTNGATKSASGISFPNPVRVGVPTVSGGSPSFNIAAGLWERVADGSLYVRDVGNSRIRKISEAGADAAFITVAATGYGIGGDEALGRVYHSIDSPVELRWYDFALAAQVGSFPLDAVSRHILVLPSGNVLACEDASPFRLREYTSAGVSSFTWFTGSASYRPQRARLDASGTWVYVSFYNAFSSSNRAIKRFLVADKGQTNANWMPGTYAPAEGIADLPWTSSSKVGDYLARVAGQLPSGSLATVMRSFHSGLGGWLQGTSAPDFTRLILSSIGSASGDPTYYDGPLADTVLGRQKWWISSYTTDSVHGLDYRTGRAEWLGAMSGGPGRKLLRVLLDMDPSANLDRDTVRPQYRIDGGPWVTVTPNDDAILGGGAGLDVVSAADLAADINTLEGFGSGVAGPLDKRAPSFKLGLQYDDGGVIPSGISAAVNVTVEPSAEVTVVVS